MEQEKQLSQGHSMCYFYCHRGEEEDFGVATAFHLTTIGIPLASGGFAGVLRHKTTTLDTFFDTLNKLCAKNNPLRNKNRDQYDPDICCRRFQNQANSNGITPPT